VDASNAGECCGLMYADGILETERKKMEEKCLFVAVV
jgi:hypothetical protein